MGDSVLFYARAGVLLVWVIVAINYFRVVRKYLFVGDGSKDAPVPPEPAFLQYFFKKSFDDLSLTVKEAWLPFPAVLGWLPPSLEGKDFFETLFFFLGWVVSGFLAIC